MYNKELFKELLLANPTLNNVEIAKLYNKHEGTKINVEKLRKRIGEFRKTLDSDNPYVNTDENKKEVNNDKGTFTSTLDSTFDPKDDIELAKLHKIDLTKYKISSYWSKLKSNGKFTSSVFCTIRKVGDSMTLDEIKTAVQEGLSSHRIKPVSLYKKGDNNEKALIVWVSDEHVGASVKDELYENDWNQSEYFNRKIKVADIIREQGKIHGSFDKIIVCTLGDTMDGFNGQTTRGGHALAQNMTNKEAIKTYVDVNKFVWDEIVSLNLTNNYYIYNVENSNHGGLGWDAAANLALEMYLTTKYPEFNVFQFEKIIDSFTYGINDFHLTHGKDDTHMKRNFPLFLNDKTENFIKEYLDENQFQNKTRFQHLVKGDLHQFTTQQGKFCSYTNIPSLFGSSGWVMSNFGKGRAGFCYSVVPFESSEFSFTPVWVK